MILVAPDKFKGTLTSKEAAEAIVCGLRMAGVDEEIVSIPMADGGEGTPEALGAKPLAGYDGVYLTPGNDLLVMSCEICGQNLKSVRPELRSSYEMGRVISEFYGRFKKIYIGIGGTLTADGGLGLLQGFGYNFYDEKGKLIEEPLSPLVATTRGISRWDAPNFAGDTTIIGLYDVFCPVASETGLSAHDFLAQKGFTFPRGLFLASCALAYAVGMDGDNEFGGAGGGIGLAVTKFPDHHCVEGARYICQLNRHLIDKASLILTGEGCIDSQTSGGKVVEHFMKNYASSSRRVIAFGGKVLNEDVSGRYIPCIGKNDSVPLTREEAFRNLSAAVASWARNNYKGE